MTERPILFNDDMVRAILEGRKTQTRRLVKLTDPTETYACHDDDGWPVTADEAGEWHRDRPMWCVGDRLYVRECWMPFDADHRPPAFAYRASTSDEGDEIRREYIRLGRDYRWRPSIHMPKEAARIWLTVKRVWIERVQDISEADAGKEGFGNITRDCKRPKFRDKWESVYHGSWDRNDWVWCCEFEKEPTP